MGLSNIEDILQAGLDGETLPTPESRIAELLKEWIEQGGNIDDILVAGANITLTKNPNGTITIAASGEVSSEDTVARAEIAAIKDGETLDSFGDVETALGDKADISTTYTKTEVDTALSAKANSADVYSKTAVDTALSNKADKSTTYTKTEIDTSLSNKADKTTTYTKTEVDTALDDKVDKETGKGLSTNDYTTAEKTKLAGIEAQANKTTVDDALSGSSTNPVQNKVVKSALDGKANASTTYTKTEVDTALSGKQNAIDSSHKLSADLVDDTNATNKFATAAELEQIETNKNNISLLIANGGGKNLLPLSITTAQTANGVIFTPQNDGTIKVTGELNAANAPLVIGTVELPAGTYVLSGSPSGGGESTWQIDTTTPSYYQDTGSGVSISLTQTTTVTVRIRIAASGTLDLLFKPMLSTSTDRTFQPYCPSNYELYQMILAL